MNPDTTSVIRDIFLMLAAGVFTALCVTLIVVVLKLYRPLRETAQNSAKTAENLSRITGNIAAVSEETSGNIAQTSRNLVDITEKAKEGTEELSTVVHSVNQAAQNLAAAASTAARVAEIVSGWAQQGTAGGASSSGIGSLLRFVRSLFVGRRGSGDGGV